MDHTQCTHTKIHKFTRTSRDVGALWHAKLHKLHNCFEQSVSIECKNRSANRMLIASTNASSQIPDTSIQIPNMSSEIPIRPYTKCWFKLFFPWSNICRKSTHRSSCIKFPGSMSGQIWAVALSYGMLFVLYQVAWFVLSFVSHTELHESHELH